MNALDSPAGAPETPTEGDDALYPCKGCGEILEEGKAFELAGNRWHIDCFRCNTCQTLLDSDANLLLLGDGSLICNNCTYSCSACGNKIEDLAILTGEQAFCASCFKCRNCKKKIENLRYARTSQGIFCMSCHESLMARRRKKNKTQSRTTSANSNGSTPTVLDKSLPALPPGALPSGAFHDSIDSPVSVTSETPTERSPAMRHQLGRKDSSDPRRDASPLSFEDFKENLMIPDESMKLKRVSEQSSHTNGSYGDDDNYIPVALDPMPRPPGPPRSRSNEKRPPLNNETQGGSEERLRENFKDLVAGSASRSHSSERGPVSPHLANQILRQGSTDRAMNLRRRNESIKPSSPTSSYNTSPVDKKPMSPASGEGSDEQFRLQEAPRIRRRSSGSKRGSKVMNGSATAPNMTLAGQTEGSPVLTQETLVEPTPPPPVPNRKVSARQRSPLSNATSASSQEPPKSSERPERKESLNKPTAPGQAIPRKQVPRHGETMPAQLNTHPPERSQDPLSQHPNTAPATVGKTITSPQGNEAFEPPPRSSSRPAPTPGLSSAAMGNQVDSKHDFTSPREAPAPPPPSTRHKTTESVSSIQSENFTARDGGTPIPHGASEVGPEDEFGRVEPDEDFDQGIFRKVSKAVRHGRSYSDKNNAGSPRFTKGSRNGSIDISSPMLPSGEGNEDNSLLRNKLRYSQQRIAELESEKNNLQEQVNGAVDIRQVNTELREKRSTMAFLDTQREMIIRELEIMTEQLTRAKEHDGPVDLDNIKHEALRDFANQMNKLKETLGSQIEQQIAQKTSLAADIDNLIQVKDKGAREAEALEHSVHQLQHLHNQLSGSIQHLYRNTATPSNGSVQAPSGLGIYNASMKDRQGSVTDERNNLDLRTALSMDNSIHSHLSGETEVEPATVLSAPRVVDMRKGQPKKFSWKKGSESMAKNVKKGFKGAFAATQSGSSNSALREDSFAESQPYGSIQAGDAPIMGDRPVGQRNGGGDAQRQTSQGGNWGLFGQKPSNAVRNALAASLPPETAVFGSDLSARCEYEKRVTPALITRCIDEVESRGMDVEGIYRKSGSYSQVKAVQQGFEKDPHGGPDLSDEEMDIHAITSALKQFLRKLPIPLITFEAYDFLIDGANEAGSSLDVTSSPIMIETCKHAIQVLPRSHKDTLEYLMGHLYRVMSREGENKMGSTNLAVVFAPTIMRPQSVDREMTDMEAQRKSVQSLLVNFHTVFA